MTLKLDIEKRHIEVPNGHYLGYDQVQETLGGHPNGIEELQISPESAIVIIQRFTENIVPNTWNFFDPIYIQQITGGIGEVEISLGQLYEYSSSVLVRVVLYNEAGIKLISQQAQMRLTHINK